MMETLNHTVLREIVLDDHVMKALGDLWELVSWLNFFIIRNLQLNVKINTIRTSLFVQNEVKQLTQLWNQGTIILLRWSLQEVD